MAGSIQQFITTAKARPPKLIRDYLSPTNSHLLSLLLADVLPPSCYPYPLSSASPNPTNSTGPSPHLAGSPSLPPLPQSPPWGKPLPLGHHLVYFPLQARPTELAWDGADNDHAPGEPYVKRMWAGGKMTFRQGWEDVLRVDGRPVVGFEEIGDARVVERGGKGNGMVVMDLKRGYGVEGEGGVVIEEVRRLVFLQGDGAKKAPARGEFLVVFLCFFGVVSSSPANVSLSFLFCSQGEARLLGLADAVVFAPLWLLGAHVQRAPHPHRPRVRPVRGPPRHALPRAV